VKDTQEQIPREPESSIGVLLMVTLFLLVLTSTGCTEKDDQIVAKAEPGPIPEAAQRGGNPEQGYDVIVNGGYMSCGMPYSAWSRVTRPQDSVPKLEGREGKNAKMPFSLTVYENPQAIELVSNNCLMCHAALFNGELVIGLGNEWLDFTGDPRQFVDTIGTYVSGEKEIVAWRKWADRISAIAPYMITDTVGVNPAPNITLALIAHHDPETLAWSNEPRIDPPPELPLPVSVPPWWRTDKKHALFYNAMGRGDHARFMMMKSLLCADSIEEAESIDAMFVHVRAYIASLDPPIYPFAIDSELSYQGKLLFEKQCSGCHGTYDLQGTYPNLLIGLDIIGTDPAYALQSYAESDRFMDWFNRSWYGEISKARPALGYIAPPLDAVWATAPFLHNGSVPTVEALLDSSKRPNYWTRDFDSPEFDRNALGWKYRILSQGKSNAKSSGERKHIYDTTLVGYSKKGHLFGDNLSNTERRAIIEYLKTL
jgi:hypothetical protein